MRHRFTLILLLSLLTLTLATGAALAVDGSTVRVGLVVAFPDGIEHQEVVTLPAGATTYDALQAADIELAVASTDYGPALCGINATGCPVENCFCDATHFWAYYHMNPVENAWAVASEGIGAFKPTDRAVEGFAWSGFDADFVPTVQPPVYTFDQIAAATGSAPAAAPWLAGLLLLVAVLAGVAGYALYRMRRASSA